MSKYVLREFYQLCDGGKCEDLLTEAEKVMVREQKAVFLTGVLQRADALNGNGRVYPEQTLRREIENYKNLISQNRAVGELDHPDDSVINLKNVSHVVTDVWWNGKDVMGKLKVLDTPSGNILKALINSGVTLGISSRALGSVKEVQGKTMVEDDLQLICFDIVSEPSTKGAFLGLSEAKKAAPLTKSDKLVRMINDILD
jgi:hypothetical protein